MLFHDLFHPARRDLDEQVLDQDSFPNAGSVTVQAVLHLDEDFDDVAENTLGILDMVDVQGIYLLD